MSQSSAMTGQSASASASFQDALDRMAMGGSASAIASSQEDFIPSSTWQGSKPGYYFGTNKQGTGYYRDSKQAQQQQGGADDNNNKKKRKGVQIAEDRNELVIVPASGGEKPSMSLLEQAEQQAKEQNSSRIVMELTPKGLRSATNALAKVVKQNALLRAQHAPHNPELYMESELALYEHITSLSAIAANVHLYQHLVGESQGNDSTSSSSSSILSTLLQLLGEHENADICASIISLFLEWIDPSLLTSDTSDNEVLLPTLSKLAKTILNDAWDTIVANLGRFQNQQQQESSNNNDDGDEEDQTLKGIDNILSLMENILELDMLIPGGIMDDASDNDSNESQLSAAAFMVKETQIVSWLFEQLEENEDDEDDEEEKTDGELPERCLELLAFVSQREDVHSYLPNWSELPPYESNFFASNDGERKPKKQKKNSIQGIEILLQIVGKYRKAQPSTDREVEHLENAAIVLSSCLTFSPQNVKAFLDGQGVELVMRCLRERVHSGGCCLKLLDFFGSDPIHKSACEHIIDAGGLKYLPPMFMGTRIPKPALLDSSSSKAAKKAKREWLHLVETQTIRILYALTCHLDKSSPNDAMERLVAKFVDGGNGGTEGNGETNQDGYKCDRLVELILSYDQKARKAEYMFYRSDVEDQVDNDDDGETIRLAALDAKIKGGGEMFHRLGAIAAFLCVNSKRCHERILSQLQLQQSGISIIKAALEEFISVLGDGHQKDQLQSYLVDL